MKKRPPRWAGVGIRLAAYLLSAIEIHNIGMRSCAVGTWLLIEIENCVRKADRCCVSEDTFGVRVKGRAGGRDKHGEEIPFAVGVSYLGG